LWYNDTPLPASDLSWKLKVIVMRSGPSANTIREVDFVSCTPDLFRAELKKRGVIILRGAISKRRIAATKAKVEAAIQKLSTVTEESINEWNWQQWWPGNSISFSIGKARGGEINDAMVRDATDDSLSFYDLISAPPFHRLLARGFPGLDFRSTPVAHCRKMSPKIGGIKLHCDIRYHRDGPFALNFWTPLDPAGEKFGTSGLEIWPIGYAAVRKYLQHNGVSPKDMRDDLIEAVPQVFGPPVRTNIDAGDVMVFTSWTLHRTYFPDSDCADRTSVEVRLAADQWPDDPLARLPSAWRGRPARALSRLLSASGLAG
jgi:hypothetical protein